MDQPAANQKQLEGDVYHPSPDVISAAYIKEYESLYQRSLQDPKGSGASAQRSWNGIKKWDKVLDDSNPPFFKWFIGGKTNIVLQRPGPPPEDLPQEQAGPDLGRRAGRHAHLLLLRPQPRSVQVRQRAAQHGRQEGRYRHHLHAAHPGAGDRHAGLRQDRRGPQRGLRRLPRRSAGRAHRGRPEPRADHRRRRLAARQDRRAEGYRRRGHGPPADHRARASWSSAPARISTWRPAAITGTTT